MPKFKIKFKWTWPTKEIATKANVFWAIYRRRQAKLESYVRMLVKNRIRKRYGEAVDKKEGNIDRLLGDNLPQPLPFYSEIEQFSDELGEADIDDLTEEDLFEFISDYVGRIPADKWDICSFSDEFKSPLAFDFETVFYSFDNFYWEEDEEYWGMPYDFDFLSDDFFLELSIFTIFVYFFLSSLLAMVLIGLYFEYMQTYTYAEDVEFEDPYNEQYSLHEDMDPEDEDDFLFSDEFVTSDLDEPDNPFIPDFQDFEVDNFSAEDLKDFYFLYNFSAVSFKFFNKFNKKFRKNH